MITLKYEDYGKKIWTPDTFIVNSVKGNRHDIVERNNYLRIFPDGEVLYSERYVFTQSIRLYSYCDNRYKDSIAFVIPASFFRLTSTLSCPMNHRLYPVGSQRCHLKFGSYAYQQKDVRYVWKSQTPIQITQSLSLKGGYSLDILQDQPFKANFADVKTSTGNSFI